MVWAIISLTCMVITWGIVLAMQRNWLEIARTQRALAETARGLAEAQPEAADHWLAKADEHDRLAVSYHRRAWPWRK